jgi:hypothetical protein
MVCFFVCLLFIFIQLNVNIKLAWKRLWDMATFLCLKKLYVSKEKRDKRTNNDLPNTTQKIKDRATQTPPKPEVKSGTQICT